VDWSGLPTVSRRSPELEKVAAGVFRALGAHGNGEGGKWVRYRTLELLGKRRKGEEQA
jgi:hypothetical protein